MEEWNEPTYRNEITQQNQSRRVARDSVARKDPAQGLVRVAVGVAFCAAVSLSLPFDSVHTATTPKELAPQMAHGAVSNSQEIARGGVEQLVADFEGYSVKEQVPLEDLLGRATTVLPKTLGTTGNVDAETIESLVNEDLISTPIEKTTES